MDKRAEAITIRNTTTASINLQGWYIISENGNQRCNLSGSIPAGASWVVRTEAGKGGDVNCGFGTPILNNSESDPTALYDNAGRLVDRVNS